MFWPLKSLYRPKFLKTALSYGKDNFHLISTTALNSNRFYESDDKDGYKKPLNVSNIQLIREGLKELKGEIGLWKEEVVETLRDDPVIFVQPGAHELVWKFDNKEIFDKWVATSDKDHNEGFSECSFSLSKNQKALFSGVLKTDLPKDGRIKKTGYCNVRSMRARKSFKREIFLEWQMYSHLLMRVRGDGRSYMLNISTSGYFDVMWNDMYQYILFTRGGPYWQNVKIPFSKFFLASKGKIQDKQHPIPLNQITSFGITCSDRIPGPFQLEIDYIGLQYDPSHHEEFAYEMYQLPNYIAGV